jgi:hypothetical protein
MAPDILSILQDLWAPLGREEPFPQLCLQTVRRMLSRWGLSWRRAHKKRRPAVNTEDAPAFVWTVLGLTAQVTPGDRVSEGRGGSLPMSAGALCRRAHREGVAGD